MRVSGLGDIGYKFGSVCRRSTVRTARVSMERSSGVFVLQSTYQELLNLIMRNERSGNFFFSCLSLSSLSS